MTRQARWLLFGVSVVLGLVIFAGGFRLTSEVTVVLAVTMLASGAMSLVWPDRAWQWGLGVGLGTRLSAMSPAGSMFHEPPLSAEHLAREGPSKPLPLPFGLTGNPVAEAVVGSLLIMAFPFVAALVAWAARTVVTGALTADR